MNEHSDTATKQQIRTNIKKIAATYGVDFVEILNCTVNSVDKTNRSANVTPISGKGATKFDVGLMPEKNDGEFKIPAIGSTVGVVMSANVDPYIFSWSDLQEWYLVIGTTTIDILNGSIKLGDGSFNGLIKIDNLVLQYNNMVDAVKAACVAAFTAQSSIDSGVGLAAFNSAATAIQHLNKAALENTKITHGAT